MKRIHDRPPQRIAVFCPNLIGDTVMATPALRALRSGYPLAHIAIVIKPHVAPTLEGAPWFDEVIRFDPRSKSPEFRFWPAVRALRKGRFDLAVLLPNSIRTGLLAWMGGARRRIGYDLGGRRWFLTDRLLPVKDAEGTRIPSPAVDYYLAIVRKLGCPVSSNRAELFTSAEDEQAADRVWNTLGLNDGRPVVCLNTGGAFGPAKAWPARFFAIVARRLVEETGSRVLVVCGPSEREPAREIVRLSDHPDVTGLADQPLSVGLTKASVKRSALLITTDSGPRHFAGAFGVPVVSLFGPTHIAWTRTYHPKAVHLQQPVPCGPCQKPVCPLGHHQCMNELSPEAVFRAAVRLLGEEKSPRRAAQTAK